MKLNPQKNLLATSSKDSTMKIWSMENASLLYNYDVKKLPMSAIWFQCLEWCPKGPNSDWPKMNGLLARYFNIIINIYIYTTQEFINKLSDIDSGTENSSVYLWNVKPGSVQCINILKTKLYSNNCMEFSPNGQYLATVNDKTEFLIWSIKVNLYICIIV